MSSDEMVKLTNEDIRWIQKRASSWDYSVKKDSEICGMTELRIQQQTKIYRDTEEVPTLNQI
ncbi:hypothetical protein C5S36_13440 [Candidatus Methanophagaceae archaeon]|jgi:hypothetical protein|nr:hypothetical protein C5S36_13440 [Methanophagales archaeon]